MMRQQPSRRAGARRVRGFSLLEVITVAGVAAVMMAVLIPQIQRVWNDTKASQSAAAHVQLTQAILDLELDNYSTFTNADLYTLAPGELRRGGNILRNRYGGDITIAPGSAITFDGGFATIPNRGLQINSNALPARACIAIARQLMTLDELNYISVNGQGVWLKNFSPDSNTITKPEDACNQPANLLIWQIL